MYMKKNYSLGWPASTAANIKRLIYVRNSLSLFASDHLCRPKHPISFAYIQNVFPIEVGQCVFCLRKKRRVFQRDGSDSTSYRFIFDKLSLFDALVWGQHFIAVGDDWMDQSKRNGYNVTEQRPNCVRDPGPGARGDGNVERFIHNK